jgi:hypothetical protein
MILQHALPLRGGNVEVVADTSLLKCCLCACVVVVSVQQYRGW